MNSKEKQAELFEKENNDCYTNDYYGFSSGYDLAQKEIRQKITDLLNKYKSKLQEEIQKKISKRTNYDKINEVLNKLSVLNELQDKL